MAKKCRQKMPWLTTFADMSTLLLAFFVLLFTVSKVDNHQYEEIVRSLTLALTLSPELTAVQQTYFKPVDPVLIDMDVTEPSVESLLELFEKLKQTFDKEQQQDQVKMEFDPNSDRIQVVFPELIAFDSGSADLQPRFIAMLRKFSSDLRGDIKIEVIGHSDRLPIMTGRFRSNWELSSARAAAVIEQLIRDGVIHPEQASAVGRADTQPIATGSRPEDHALNRRVEILIERKK